MVLKVEVVVMVVIVVVMVVVVVTVVVVNLAVDCKKALLQITHLFTHAFVKY